MMTDKPLWTDEDIKESTHRSFEHHPGVGWVVQQYRVKSLMARVRDDYQAALDAANARVAELEGERQAWRAEALRLRDAIMQMDSGNLRQVEAVPYVPMPDDVKEAMLELCNFVAANAAMGIGEPSRIDKQNTEYVDEVRAWLDTQEANDGR